MTLKQLDDTWRSSLADKAGQNLIKAVRSATLDGSMTAISLTAALERFEDELYPEVRAGYLKDGSVTAEGRRAVTLYGQLLAAEMLLLISTRSFKALRVKMLHFLDISSSVVKASYDFIGKAVDTLSYNFKSLGYDWSNVENATSLDILQFAGSPEKVSELSAKFLPGDLASDANRVLSLLVALGASSEYEDEVKVSRDAVREAICRILGVGDRFLPDGQAVRGKYGRGEGQRLEFKSSYVMRNDGKGPDIDYQGRGQVFEAVCAFLNSDGGTVYIGVNDKTGDPIVSEDYGLKGDISWLCENYPEIDAQRYRQLGYHVLKPDSLDHFVLFLNAEKELYFKKSLWNNIIIEATEDQDAIRISVSKSQYEIAYLYRDAKSGKDGQAFMRDGGRTVRMTQLAKEQRLMSLKSIKREMDFIVTLQEAIDRKRKVVLKDYASGNSGTIRDRFVVPVNLFYNDENVYC